VAPAVDEPLTFALTSTEPLADIASTRVTGPAALPDLSFELDLAALDAAAPAAHAEPLVSEHGSLDMKTPALHEPFDAQATEPLPLAEIIHTQAGDALDLDLDLELDFGDAPPLIESLADSRTMDLPLDLDVAAPAPSAEPEAPDDEHVKVVGGLRIGIPLFNIYLNEADELSRRLTTEVAEWAMELHRPIGETPIALAHSLAGCSATVGFAALSHLARLLEHAQARTLAIGNGTP